jgi:arylsulfatase A-like enzyme
MNDSNLPTAPPRQRLASIAPALLSGLAAGAAAGALDLRQACGDLGSAKEVGLLALQVLARCGLAGAALALLGALAVEVGGQIGRRAARSEREAAAAIITLLALPGLAYVSVRLFQGGVTSRLPARPALIGAAAVFLIALFFAGVRVVLAFIARADRRAPRDLAVLAGAALALAAALALRWCDAHLYRRLYLFLHAALALCTLTGLILAWRAAVFRAPAGRKAIRTALAGAALFALLFAAAAAAFDARQTVKVAVYERTATTSNLLMLTSGTRRAEGGPVPTAAARRERYEREKRERAAVAGSLPAFPGAHLVVVTVDALRADRLGVYGNTARPLSPHIDEFAKRAVVFERAYCTAPHSSYSISALHTSRYVHDEAILGKSVVHPTIAELLKAAGYATTAFYTQGIFFTEGDNVGYYRQSRFGFENAYHGAPRPKQLTDSVIAEVDRLMARGEPAFFVWAHYFNVHEPYLSTRFGGSPSDRYDGEISDADAEVGRLLAHLERKLARDAVIVVAADHGEEFLDHGGQYHGSSLFEEQVRVPLIIKVPGASPKRISHPVSLLDVAPTALALLGHAPAQGMAGQDLRPAIFGGDAAHVPRPVFATVMREHMALDWPWKLFADPSRGLFALYDLAADPAERVNRYDERRDVAEHLLEETRIWLDDFSRGDDPASAALSAGRMHDTRAIPGLLGLAEDAKAPADARVEALELVGEIRAWKGIERLERLLDDADVRVARGAALALAAMRVDLGRDLLRGALYDDDPAIRDEAALALAGLGDLAAVPALVEALGRDDLKIREDAIRALGELRDPAAVEPLIETIAEERTRYLSVLALGEIGDPRAYDTLVDVLDYDTHTDVRGYAVVALGWMGLAKSIPRLLSVLAEEPEIKWTSEALVRLGAVGAAPLFGIDAAQGEKALVHGFGTCSEKALVLPDEFLERTKCATTGPAARLAFYANAPDGATLIVRARHLLADKGAEAKLAIRVDGREVSEVALGGEMREARVDVGPGVFGAGAHIVDLKLGAKGAFELDHLLVLAKGVKR